MYCQLSLNSYGLDIGDLTSLRACGSLTHGHPKHGHAIGVETTTGPLSKGVGNGVFTGMAARRERGPLDPDAAPGESVFDHQIYVIAGDDCLRHQRCKNRHGAGSALGVEEVKATDRHQPRRLVASALVGSGVKITPFHPNLEV